MPASIEPSLTVSGLTVVPTESQLFDLQQGKELAESVCIICHSYDRVEKSRKTRAEWEAAVIRMVGHGAVLSQTDQQLVVSYLADTYK